MKKEDGMDQRVLEELGLTRENLEGRSIVAERLPDDRPGQGETGSGKYTTISVFLDEFLEDHPVPVGFAIGLDYHYLCEELLRPILYPEAGLAPVEVLVSNKKEAMSLARHIRRRLENPNTERYDRPKEPIQVGVNKGAARSRTPPEHVKIHSLTLEDSVVMRLTRWDHSDPFNGFDANEYTRRPFGYWKRAVAALVEGGSYCARGVIFTGRAGGEDAVFSAQDEARRVVSTYHATYLRQQADWTRKRKREIKKETGEDAEGPLVKLLLV